MSVNNLPIEILQNILKHLPGISVVRCRAVCSRWRDAVDSLSDTQWRQICSKEYLRQEYEEDHEKHGLSWYDTFRARRSWSKISKAELTTATKLVDFKNHVVYFKVLPNGIVSWPESKVNSVFSFYCDTILYYDTNTAKECDRQEYDFSFEPFTYDENKYLLVFVLQDKRICITVKETKQKYFVGSLENYPELTLKGKKVYFKNSDDEKIYCSSLNDDNILITKCHKAFEKFENFEDATRIIHFVEKNDELIFLSDPGADSWCFKVFKLTQDGGIEWVDTIDVIDNDFVFPLIQEAGFDWKTTTVYRWFNHVTNMRPIIINKASAFYGNETVILSTSNYGKTINIHFTPNCVYGMESLNKFLKTKKPARRINLKDVFPEGPVDSISQLEIIETKSSHKIVAKTTKGLYVFDLKLTSGNSYVKSITQEKTLHTTKKVKKLSENGRAKKTVLAKKNVQKPSQDTKTIKSVTTKKKGIKKGVLKHTYDTRSRTKM